MIKGLLSTNEIATIIVDAAFRVHTQLGPGLLESVYETCLEHELKQRGLLVERQRPHPVVYDGLVMEDGFRFDLLVERKVVVEIKSVDELAPVFSNKY